MEMTLSQNISRLRKVNSMTQEQLAEALGISFAAVSKWERGVTTPELGYIIEMADLFGVSVDALLGYQVQSGACEALAERLYELQVKKNFTDAVGEMEKALVRYPNSFHIVYRCGQIYYLMGVESCDRKTPERAIELLEHAILLLPQNTDRKINEYTIRADIAQCYIMMGKTKEGIELLERYNVGGVHNAQIGHVYVMDESSEPEKAEEYLMKAFADSFSSVIRIMCGYATYHGRKKEYQAAQEAVLWLVGYLESLKLEADKVAYVDKILAILYAQNAVLSENLAKPEEAKKYLERAYDIATAFDAAPQYNIYGLKFCIGETKYATAYDDLGTTAMEAIEGAFDRNGEVETNVTRAMWEKILEEKQRKRKTNEITSATVRKDG